MSGAAIRRHADWAPAWSEPSPKPIYDVIVVGGGGHGLATAYYLAKNHGLTNVAMLEAGWIGDGNTGRNTTIVRSNYLYPESARLYDFSLRLYESLSRDLNFNIMLSPRGVVTLAHSRHDLDAQSRWAHDISVGYGSFHVLRQVSVEFRTGEGEYLRYRGAIGQRLSELTILIVAHT